MLAPLRDRSVIEQENPEPFLTDAPDPLAELQTENAALRLALRLARREQRLSATRTAGKIAALENEITRLHAILGESRQRLTDFESGHAIMELGRKLMQVSSINDELTSAAQRLWTLDKTLCAAQEECQRLACERDCLATRLAAHTSQTN